MKKGILYAVLLATVLAIVPCLWAVPDTAPAGTRWVLVFEDNFDGTSLDTSKWNYHYPWSRSHNHEAYSTTDNVWLENGHLVLRAREARPGEDLNGFPYATGVINTNGKFTANVDTYIEARIDMPSAIKSWPAFWLLYTGWPPEIDIMEFPVFDSGSYTQYYTNYHYSGGSYGAWVSGLPNLTTGYHTYGFYWHDDHMSYYFDDQWKRYFWNADAIAEMPWGYMILNYAVGGWPGSPTSWPGENDPAARTYVDWVRVWQLEPDPYTGTNRRIVNRASGKVMDAYGNENGSNVIIYTDYGTTNQRWNIESLGDDLYSIRSAQSGNRSIDVWNWGTGNGTNIALYSYWGGGTQQFYIDDLGNGYVRITPVISTGQCLDAYGTASGSNVGTWSYWGGDNQQWSIE